MQSCFYEGHIQHRRFWPVRHEFIYPLFMVYVDLAELDNLFGSPGLWSSRWPAVARFRRKDHLGDPRQSLDESIRDLVQDRLRFRPSGPVRLLTNFRYFGFRMNPVSLYYCFDSAGESIEAVVAEVSNTPWDERHAYVLDLKQADIADGLDKVYLAAHQKEFHVSPFMNMDIQYRWELTFPGSIVINHIENHDSDRKIFDATLAMWRTPMTRFSRLRVLAKYPPMTAKTFIAIYWQAFRLWRKGVPFVPHPRMVLKSTESPAVKYKTK